MPQMMSTTAKGSDSVPMVAHEMPSIGTCKISSMYERLAALCHERWNQPPRYEVRLVMTVNDIALPKVTLDGRTMSRDRYLSMSVYRVTLILPDNSRCESVGARDIASLLDELFPIATQMILSREEPLRQPVRDFGAIGSARSSSSSERSKRRPAQMRAVVFIHPRLDVYVTPQLLEENPHARFVQVYEYGTPGTLRFEHANYEERVAPPFPSLNTHHRASHYSAKAFMYELVRSAVVRVRTEALDNSIVAQHCSLRHVLVLAPRAHHENWHGVPGASDIVTLCSKDIESLRVKLRELYNEFE